MRLSDLLHMYAHAIRVEQEDDQLERSSLRRSPSRSGASTTNSRGKRRLSKEARDLGLSSEPEIRPVASTGEPVCVVKDPDMYL